MRQDSIYVKCPEDANAQTAGAGEAGGWGVPANGYGTFFWEKHVKKKKKKVLKLIVHNFVNYTSMKKTHYGAGHTVLHTPETTDLCTLNR